MADHGVRVDVACMFSLVCFLASHFDLFVRQVQCVAGAIPSDKVIEAIFSLAPNYFRTKNL